jgi:uncharacterized protein with gpF-like domain
VDRTLKLLFKTHRKQMTKLQRAQTRNLHHPRRMVYPWALEKSYQQFLSNHLKGLTTFVKQQFKAHGERILKGDSANLHLDALPGKLWSETLDKVRAAAKVFVPEDADALEKSTFGKRLKEGFDNTADGVNGYNRAQWMRQTKQMLGFEFDTSQDWWPVVKDQWAKRNYELIKSATSTYIGKINDLVEKSVVNGGSYRDLMDQLDQLDIGYSESKTRLIARDQIGKLNGRVSQGRMADAGVTNYVWMTAEDDRVRGDPGGKYPDADPSHYLMDGKTCSWDDASVYSDDDGETWLDRLPAMPEGGPGDDIQCRCVAAPAWKGLLKSLDAELNDEESA